MGFTTCCSIAQELMKIKIYEKFENIAHKAQICLEFPQFCPQNTQPVLLFIHNFSKMPKI